MKIATSADRAELGKIEQGDIDAWRAFNGSFTNVEVTPSDLLQRICDGYAYTAQHRRYRKADNFLAGQHIALDMDTGDERSSFEHLLQNEFINQHAAFLHTTPSHTAEMPKARVVFVLDRPIYEAGKYALLAESLVHRFQTADRMCKDAARFFYGAKGCDSHWLGNVLSLETAAAELVEPYRRHLEAEREAATESRVVVGSGNVPERLLQAHSTSLLERVRTAPDGQKYETLRNVSIAFGGYVAGGYYGEGDVLNWLDDAIRQNPNNVQDLRAAFAAIRESVAYGKGRPLYFELSEKDGELTQRLDDIHPPLLPEQKSQIAAIVEGIQERRIWQAFHDGMAHVHREIWQVRYGLAESAVDYFGLGYCKRQIDETTGEIVEDALTVPFRDIAGDVVNVEYRLPGGQFAYEQTVAPSLCYVNGADDAPLILADDSLTAITTYLHFGSVTIDGKEPTIAGLPHLPIDETAVEHDRVIVILSPGTETAGRGLGKLRSRARFLRLPYSIDKLANHVDRREFGWMLRQAKAV